MISAVKRFLADFTAWASQRQTILAVALEVVLILVVVGLTTGITSETAKRTAGVGAEIMVQPPNSSMILALANNTMPVALADEIRKFARCRCGGI